MKKGRVILAAASAFVVFVGVAVNSRPPPLAVGDPIAEFVWGQRTGITVLWVVRPVDLLNCRTQVAARAIRHAQRDGLDSSRLVVAVVGNSKAASETVVSYLQRERIRAAAVAVSRYRAAAIGLSSPSIYALDSGTVQWAWDTKSAAQEAMGVLSDYGLRRTVLQDDGTHRQTAAQGT
jgi:hypothetical protein